MAKICLFLILISAHLSLQKSFNFTGVQIDTRGIDDIESLLVPPSSKVLSSIKNPLFGSHTSSSCSKLVTPMNSKVVCRTSWLEKECEITCFTGYFVDTVFGEENCLKFTCKNGFWTETKNGMAPPAKCLPKCDPACTNGGICVLPNTCQCPPNYYGPTCEVKNIPCTSFPAIPNFSQRKCNEKKCLVSCLAGRVFPDGSSSVEMFCDDGRWKLSKPTWDTLPNCEAVCSSPCLNGGKCIGKNTCMCSEEFRGSHCQYHVSQCDPSKLNFNGAYNCTGNDEVSICHLSCPPNTRPSHSLEPVYTCSYSEGMYKPNDIPQCEYGSRITETEIIRTEKLITESIAASCLLWNSQVKMLNDKILSFRSNCAFTVLEDNVDNLFHIQVVFSKGLIRKVILFINNMEYIITKSDDGNPSVVLTATGQRLSIPSQLTDLKIEIASGNSISVYLPAVETYLVWNLEDELQIDTTEKYSNRAGGLCGRRNSVLGDDWRSLVSSSVVNYLGDKCEEAIEPEEAPTEPYIKEAKIISERFVTESIFQACFEKISVKEFAAALEWSYEQCTKSSRQECVCQFYSKFVQHCNQILGNFEVNWREKFDCSIKCPANEIYTNCVPVSQTTCSSQEVARSPVRKYCTEGCACAPGTVLHEGKCIDKDVCPCIYGGKFYEPNSIIPKDCNKCTCSGGKWICTDEICKAECLIFGDPHYRTFDGKKFDFSGFCTYKLVVTDNVTIETVNGVCNKCALKTKTPSTTKSVIIRVGNNVIDLKSHLRAIVNKEEVENLPVVVGRNTYIRKASSLVIQVILPNGLEVLWNGKSKLQIFANASLFGKTKGLCGTFNKNQQDDLLTPENDIEKSITAFANKWRSNEKCEAEREPYDGSNACEIYVQNKVAAEEYCKNLTGPIFQDCHSVIDPNVYYEDCLNDVCSCRNDDPSECYCPILSAYAQECARVGIILDWRSKIRSCGIPCPSGQKYEPCGSSCQRSCADIAHGEICRGSCTEGCYCPSGQALDENEECIPIKSCPCTYRGHKYPPGYIDIRNRTEVWECRNAAWESKISTFEELEVLQKRFICKSPNMVYVQCEPPEPVTCRNMHNPPKYTSKTCQGGCVCEEGFVLEPITKECVRPADCPCHHGGRSYADQEIINQDCNNCTCTKGKWTCTESDCNSVCTTWGDSHFRTFDGRYYDFQGTCDYVFAKGQLSDVGFFSVSVEIVPCGTGGTSCTQSLTVTAGNTAQTESLFLAPQRGSDLTKEYKKFEIILTGLNVIVVLKGYSVILIWDKSTRVTLQVDPIWKSKITGLCGNNNGNAEDDFQSPAGGLIEALPDVFADSWKLQQHCPFPGKIQNPCVVHPQRKFWSILKCSMLKDSPVFQRCHAQVPVEDFYKRCVFDACACDQGGDCECLCTSFAAYTQECSAKGVILKWRRQDLCPIQCEMGTKYSPCISSCPEKTCESLYNSDSSCEKVSCVEGCEKVTCPDQKVRLNSTSSECISPKECPCMIINGTLIKEQQEISKDDCHLCICTGGKKKCMGLPCEVTTHSPPPIEPITMAPPINCKTGWSDWASIDRDAMNRLVKDDITYASPSSRINCKPSEMVGVQCQARTENTSEPQLVECSFDTKIEYPQNCTDFQINVRCECDYTTVITYSSESKHRQRIIDEPVTLSPKKLECEVRCGDLCHSLLSKMEDQGHCLSPEDCIERYVNGSCSDGLKLRDSTVCVKPEDCTCMSKNNTLVRPSVYMREPSDCSICQCFDNKYDCSLGRCLPPPPTEVVKPTSPPEEPEPTPPTHEQLPYCSPRKLVPIDQNATYKSSSNFVGSEPKLAKLQRTNGRTKNTKAWKANDEESKVYLEVDLGSRLPVYAIDIAGCVENYEFVKSFKLQYSTDGVTFYSALATSGSKIFGGCYDPRIPERELLKEAVEARYLRVRPITWQNGITMLISVLGCSSKKPMERPCMQQMGIESGELLPHQVTVSSKLNDDFHPHDLSINSATGWVPLIASGNEYVEFNFYDERTIDGIITKGTSMPFLADASWTEAFKVRYSIDGKKWLKILNDDNDEKVFPANFDSFSPYLNTFSVPLKARMLRLYPVKWNYYPSLRVEIMGCYLPYDNVPPPPAPLPPNVCDGIKLGSEPCRDQLYWNGTDCAEKEFCPCVDELFVHKVGAVFYRNSCTKCTCSLGGSASCEEVVNDCSTCTDQKMLYSINEKCGCECSPCPSGTVLCPTSNICINASLWCDGNQNCADDEQKCVDVHEELPPTNATSVPFIEVSTPPPTPKPTHFCPIPSCAQAYTKHIKLESLKPIMKPSRWSRPQNVAKKITFTKVIETVVDTVAGTSRKEIKTSVKEYTEVVNKQSIDFTGIQCKAWDCLTGDECPEKPRCPFGSTVQFKSMEANCPKYACIPSVPNERDCKVNGPLISTFDGSHFSYEVCDHVLAQDKFKNWRVRKLNKCAQKGCETSIIIRHFSDDIQFFTNFTTLFNGLKYTIPQLRAIGAKSELFSIETVADKFVIFSSFDLKFSAILGLLGTTRIVVDAGLHNLIDGLCGHFDFDAKNDKMKPDGSITSFTEEFGNSWKYGNETCGMMVCPEEVQKRGREFCQALRKSPFDVCDFTLDIEAEISKCISSICTCAAHSTSLEKDCRCLALESFSLSCIKQQPGSDLSIWRVKHNCAMNCTPPFIYQECFDRHCEPGCSSLINTEECPRLDNRCFSGCYCPTGFLREGDTCIESSKCRDAECSSNSLHELTTFDNVQIPFDENCGSFILLQTKDTENIESELKIIVSQINCGVGTKSFACPAMLTVKVDKREVKLYQVNNTVMVKVDDVLVTSFPRSDDAITLTEQLGVSVTMSVPSFKLDVIYMVDFKGFSIRLPSYMYSEKLRGLCGSCNHNQWDDVIDLTGTSALSKYTNPLRNWQMKNPVEADQLCPSPIFTPPKNCAAPNNDICSLLMDTKVFGKCNIIVDPSPYVEKCRNIVCNEGSHCNSFGAYAEECYRNGFCVSWRNANRCPYNCPPGMEYQACGSSCEITCDNYENENAVSCSDPFMERCGCPKDQVLLNGTCVEEVKCKPCDSFGHYAGSKWKQGNCTECECTLDRKVNCYKKECHSDIICPMGYKKVIDKNNDDPCCQRYVCDKPPEENCPPLIQIECGKYQEKQLSTLANNCSQYICSCLPKEMCPKLMEEDSELLPGMVQKLKTDGCCPEYELSCNTDACPLIKECGLFEKLVENKKDGHCCPDYECVPPPSACIYEYKWMVDSDGTERVRLNAEITKELKQAGETWLDGLCHECVCRNETHKAICTRMKCSPEPVSDKYVMQAVHSPEECCPKYKTVACKVDGIELPVNQSIRVINEPCKSIKCVQNGITGEITRVDVQENCKKDCKPGWDYQESDNSSVCCGSCKQTACVDTNNMVHIAGSDWYSSDNCTKFECDTEFNIIGFGETCPRVENCAENKLYWDGCCHRCNFSLDAQRLETLNCSVQTMKLNETIGFISKSLPGNNTCTNPKPITGLTFCEGHCESKTFYDSDSYKVVNSCGCCIGVKFKTKLVRLTCKDGPSINQNIQIPEECSCNGCAAAKNSDCILSV